MSGEHDGEAVGGLSRRQLLTRGAIAGGLVWAAPIIRTTAAYATTANGTERPCTNFFMVTIDKNGHASPEPRDLNSRDVPPAIRQWFADNPGVTVQFPSVSPLLTQTSDTAWAVLLPEVSGPNAAARQCRLVIGWDEKGHKYAEAYVDPNPPISAEAGRRIIFPCPDPGHDGGGDGDDDNHGGGGDGDGDDGGSGGTTTTTTTTTTTPGGDDGGCKNGHDDGDHDADDVACDPSASLTAAGTTGTGTADATVAPVAAASSTISSDGSGSSGTIGSDGGPSGTVSSDGKPSTDHGASACINLVYLIYCCPQ